MVARVERQRMSTLRTLYLRGRAMESIQCFQTLHNAHSGHGKRGSETRDNSKRGAHSAATTENSRGDLQSGKEVIGQDWRRDKSEESPRAAHAQSRADHGETKALGENESKQFTTTKTDCFQNCQFAESLAYRHAHGAGTDENQSENDNRADRIDQHFDIAPH